jgi:hypothetical protein
VLASARLFHDHDDRYLHRFLLWIQEKTGREWNPAVSCTEFGETQSIPMDAVWSLVDQLRERGLVRVEGRDGAGPGREGAPVVALEAAGAEEARRLRTRRADPVERGRHARQAVLRWIQARSERQPLRINGFLDSPDSFFLGEALTRGEVAQALSYLAEVCLINCQGPPFHNGVGSEVALTPRGVDAVNSGLDITGYVAREQEQARPVRHTVIDAGTVNLFEGDVHNRITVHAGFSPGDLARLIRQFSPGLGIQAPEDHAELLRVADELARAGGSNGGGGPEPDRQRGLMGRIRHLLGAAPDTVGRQLLMDMVMQVMGRVVSG